jgi:VIT1/CCC1 family predicted Fe2+/Mn2+ transporter
MSEIEISSDSTYTYVVNIDEDYMETSKLIDSNNGNDYDTINKSYFEQPSLENYMPSFGHVHYSQRAPWLRAAILGLNDGLVSTSSTMLGVGGGSNNNGAMFIAGVAALVAGSLAMVNMFLYHHKKMLKKLI